MIPKIGDTMYWMYYIDKNQCRVVKCRVNDITLSYLDTGEIDIYDSYFSLMNCGQVFIKKFCLADIGRICYRTWEDCITNDYRCVLDIQPFEWKEM